jgi:hypothetical protein
MIYAALLALVQSGQSGPASRPAADSQPSVKRIASSKDLRVSLAAARPGDTLLVPAGIYEGGITVSSVRGEAGKPIVVRAADPKNPPLFRGGTTGLHLSGAAHVELADLGFEGSAATGINIDDAGKLDTPSHHITLRNLKVSRVGADGNEDGIKLSGVEDFRVEGCTVDRWGSAGSAIDMVGCHRGAIEGNTFTHTGAGGNAIQTKGGCAEIAIRRNRFENAGTRAIQLGGSTSLQYFRPPIGSAPHPEARDITVEGNTILGSEAAIAFVGVDGAIVRFNTIHVPHKWAIRILQESAGPGFPPCRNGRFTDNVVVFESPHWAEGGINVGPGTEPASFAFARNLWFCSDAPERSKPNLPSEEKGGVYGSNPMFRDAAKGDLRLLPDSPAKAFGAEALK